MEPPLADKVAFFQCLSAMRNEDDQDNTFDPEEQAHRDKCKSYYLAASTQVSGKSSSSALHCAGNPRTASEQPSSSQSGNIDDDLVIIKVTPRNMSTPQETKAKKRGRVSGVNEEVVPDTMRPNDQSVPAFLNPMLQSRTTRQPSTQKTPSASTSKRKTSKKQAGLKLLPENQQIFKGFRFYYIPNDNRGIRKAQIPKAQERGATWVRTLQEATHIIVDQSLTYRDIEPVLRSDADASSKIIVNGTYPPDCSELRVLLDPSQEKYVRNLRAPEAPKENDATDETIPSSLPSNTSLPVKGKKRSFPGTDQDRSSGDASSEEEPDGCDAELPPPKGTALATSVDDELSQFIGLVQADPMYLNISLEEEDEELYDHDSTDGGIDDTVSETSDDERSKKKKRKVEGRKQPIQAEASWQNNFACMTGGTKGGTSDNPNARTIELLQKMADQYEGRDHFRALSYRKGVTTLRQQNKKITTAEEAIKLRNIGRSLADKIEEIVTRDRLEKLEYAEQRPEDKIIKLFLKIYGVGINKAIKWVHQGHRTLEDLREKVKLTPSQRIGIEHYDDLNQRIPRWEVEALATVVRDTAMGIDPSVKFIIGGSYRRGSDTTGDIDLIVTKKGTKTTQDLLPFFRNLIKCLVDSGFLTVSLATFSNKTGQDDGSKWHGCCVLPQKALPDDKGQYRPVWRRIDLLLVPESQFGAALLYFTGNDIFNRSMRLLASKKGMNLNQRGLYDNVQRGPGRIKLNEGDFLEGRDEKKIFELLGVKWREPHERWC